MAEKYTEAQKRASLRYQKDRAQVKITIPKEQRERWKDHAKQKNTDLTHMIIDLVERDIESGN